MPIRNLVQNRYPCRRASPGESAHADTRHAFSIGPRLGGAGAGRPGPPGHDGTHARVVQERQYKEAGLRQTEVRQLLGVSRATVYRYLESAKQ